MRLYWGSYAFPANECDVRSRSVVKQAGGRPYSRVTTMTVLGRLYGTGQADLTAKQNALQNALSIQFQDLVLKQDTGAASATLLVNAGSLTGVTITAGPHFENNAGAEYATQRSFSFVAEAEYPLAGTAAVLLSFEEQLTFRGGGRHWIFRPNIYGPFQKQLVYPATPYRATQRGSAVGYLGYPSAPGPIWPADEHVDARDVSQTSPKRVGSGYTEYGVSWSYEFESAAPLVGSPNVWPANL